MACTLTAQRDARWPGAGLLFIAFAKALRHFEEYYLLRATDICTLVFIFMFQNGEGWRWAAMVMISMLLVVAAQ